MRGNHRPPVDHHLALNIYDWRVLVIHEEQFYMPTPYRCREIIKNINYDDDDGNDDDDDDDDDDDGVDDDDDDDDDDVSSSSSSSS